MGNLKQKAQELRKNTTPQERKLWNLIKNRQFFGHYFRRQFVIEPYIVDFICREKKIIIEIDGSQHLQTKDKVYDKKRTEYLNSLGYIVIRFLNNEIDNNIDGVYERLKTVFKISD